MKIKRILLTAGGTGGHIYPTLAIAEVLRSNKKENFDLRFIGPKNSRFEQDFFDLNIPIYSIMGAKIRRYFDIRNLIDIPRFLLSILEALIKLFFMMPDVVFSKGGPGSLAVVIAAKFYMIPIVIHESDAAPSLTSKLSSRLAKRIGVSFQKTAGYFPDKKVFLSGNPIRKGFLTNIPDKLNGRGYFQLILDKPVVTILGGSQGAKPINDMIAEGLDSFLENFQVIHQAGEKNMEDIAARDGYAPRGFFNKTAMKNALAAADIVISRAGAGAIFEIATIGRPSILIPLQNSANNHQVENAYEYSKSGACLVFEESNLEPNILINQIKQLLGSPDKVNSMEEAAKNFAKPKAAKIIANEIINL